MNFSTPIKVSQRQKHTYLCGMFVRKKRNRSGTTSITNLTAEEVYANYHGLWVVEKVFRVTQGTLEIRAHDALAIV